ncbi:putative phosphoprotein [Long Island tick rhabdovirus]|uniref:Putative phosphoprotein n=1 Tax=Long Island tick rhabdovirus TaxID=1459044 RepID=W8QED6_9RHAB|nr:putative phosphoprotein [Long Island tick rhabdovirus]AHL66982.1 putative phosphoprotein [Long Island tick rhabdovirus]
MQRAPLNSELIKRMAGGLRATLAAGTDEDPSLNPTLAHVEGPESKTWDARPLPGETDSSEDEDEDPKWLTSSGDSSSQREEALMASYHDQMDELVGKMGGFDLSGYLNSGNGTHKCAEYRFRANPSPITTRELRRFISFLKDHGFIRHAVYSSKGVTVYGSVRTSPPETPETHSPEGSVSGEEPCVHPKQPPAGAAPRQPIKVPRLDFGFKLWYKTPLKRTIKVDPAIVCQDNGCTTVTPPDQWLEHHRESHQRPVLDVTRLIYVETIKSGTPQQQ